MSLPQELLILIKEKIPFYIPPNIHAYILVKNAVEKSNLPLLQWLLSKDVMIEHILDAALEQDNLFILKWLHAQNPRLTIDDLPPPLEDFYSGNTVTSPIQALVKRGQLKILQFLHASKMYTFSQKDIELLYLADQEEHFNIVLWLHEDIGVSFPFEDFIIFLTL